MPRHDDEQTPATDCFLKVFSVANGRRPDAWHANGADLHLFAPELLAGPSLVRTGSPAGGDANATVRSPTFFP